MRITRNTRSAIAAAAIVAAVAAAPFLIRPDAEARTRRAKKAVASFATESDNTRPVSTTRGPFFGLRVNSMDVGAAVKIISCFDYRCPGIQPSTSETYQLVRSIQADREITTNACDEVFGPISEGVRYRAQAETTRWIRDIGPNGVTPVGGWIGSMRIVAIVDVCEDITHRATLFNIGLIGTQGLRPRRGDTADPANEDEADRCSAPFHDEGYYQGYPHKPGLRLLARHFQGDAAAIAQLRTISRSVLAGTFEGRLGVDATAADPFDFCQLRKVGWWFDGVMGYGCRMPATDPADPVPAPAPLPEDEALFEEVQ